MPSEKALDVRKRRENEAWKLAQSRRKAIAAAPTPEPSFDKEDETQKWVLGQKQAKGINILSLSHRLTLEPVERLRLGYRDPRPPVRGVQRMGRARYIRR